MQVKRDSIRRTDGETARHGVARLHNRAISERSVLALLTIFFWSMLSLPQLRMMTARFVKN